MVCARTVDRAITIEHFGAVLPERRIEKTQLYATNPYFPPGKDFSVFVCVGTFFLFLFLLLQGMRAQKRTLEY